MAEKIGLNESNQEGLSRLSLIINASSTALANYLINKGLQAIEQGLKHMDKEVLEAFKKALEKKG